MRFQTPWRLPSLRNTLRKPYFGPRFTLVAVSWLRFVPRLPPREQSDGRRALRRPGAHRAGLPGDGVPRDLAVAVATHRTAVIRFGLSLGQNVRHDVTCTTRCVLCCLILCHGTGAYTDVHTDALVDQTCKLKDVCQQSSRSRFLYLYVTVIFFDEDIDQVLHFYTLSALVVHG